MSKAIGMIEFSSIAKGIETCDFMLKAAQVNILKSCTVCPGKYIVIVAGYTGDVNASIARGRENGGKFIVNTLIIPNVNDQLIPAIGKKNKISSKAAIGVLEFRHISSGILAADLAVKAANIDLIEVKIGFAIGGKGLVILTGDVGAVREAIQAVENKVELAIQTTVIPRPSDQLFEALL